MKPVLFYLLQVIIASAILYGYYHFALRNKKFHHYNRFYLLGAIVVSVLIPFLNIPVYFTASETGSSPVLQTLTILSNSGGDSIMSPSVTDQGVQHYTWFSQDNLLYAGYILIALLALVRIIFSLRRIRLIAANNPVEKLNDIYFVNTGEPGTPFSFFRWLFWNNRIELNSSKGEQIFRHEIFHIRQRHSLDIIFMELLTVVFWINPFFHLIKKEIKAIHEFLADKFAVQEDQKWDYAELLLMQALNTQQHLVNPFFHNQIKRRIAMITSSSKPGQQYLRKLMVLPIAALVVGLFAFSYKTRNSNAYDRTEKQQNTMDTTKPGFKAGAQALIMDSATNLREWTITGGKLIVDSKGNLKTLSDVTLTLNDFDSRDTLKKELLVLIDGKIQPELKSLSDIDRAINMDDIESISVLKGQSAMAKYGEKGRNGAMEIITRNGKKSLPVKEVTLEPDMKMKLVTVEDITLRELKEKIIKEGAVEERKVKEVHEKVKEVKEGPVKGKEIKEGPVKDKEIIEVLLEERKVKEVPVEKRKVKEVSIEEIKEVDNKIFEKVEIEASFPGGYEKWKQYSSTYLNEHILPSTGCPPGVYTVVVQFVVQLDGTLSDIRALTHHGYGMEKNAINLISNGPKWIPAVQNGHQVVAYRKQTVTYVIREEKVKTNSQKSPEITVEKLRKSSTYDLLKVDPGTEILSYAFAIDQDNGAVGVAWNYNNQFSSPTKTLIQNATAGKTITIDYIKIMKDGKEKKEPSKVYYVVD